MPYTNILRMWLSGLRRIPGQVNRQTHLMGQCQNLTPSSRLITVRGYGALAPRLSIDNSQHSLFCISPFLISVSNTQITRYSVASEGFQMSKQERKEDRKKKRKLQKILEQGLVQALEPRTVTSLPEKFKSTGNETFVTCIWKIIGKFPNHELLQINASSGSDSFQQVCKPTQENIENIAHIVGMEYDEKLNQLLRDGKPVELTCPREAIQQFIGFLKKHNKPVLVFYDRLDSTTCIPFLLNKWGLLDDFLSEVPYCLDAQSFVRKTMKKEEFENLKLTTICEKLMGLKFEQEDQMKRVDALHRLFTEHLQQKADETEYIHTNTVYTRNSLIKEVVDGQIPVITMDKLSKVGIGLDHLYFLAEKGSDEFVSCLVDRGLQKHEAENLYSVFQK